MNNTNYYSNPDSQGGGPSLDIMPMMPHANIGIIRVYILRAGDGAPLNINAIWSKSIKTTLWDGVKTG